MTIVRKKIHTSSPLYCFGDMLKKLRKESGLSQTQFAKNFNVSLDAVKNWEQHYNIPEMECIMKLCEYFQCDIDFLFGRIEKKTNNIQFIHDKTGLSENVIELLIDNQHAYQIINKKEKSDPTIASPVANAFNQIFKDLNLTMNLIACINNYIEITECILSILNAPPNNTEKELISIHKSFSKTNETDLEILKDIRYEKNTKNIQNLKKDLNVAQYKLSIIFSDIVKNISKDIPQYNLLKK